MWTYISWFLLLTTAVLSIEHINLAFFTGVACFYAFQQIDSADEWNASIITSWIVVILIVGAILTTLFS